MSEQDYEQLTLFPADSHASPSPWLESRRAKRMIDTLAGDATSYHRAAPALRCR